VSVVCACEWAVVRRVPLVRAHSGLSGRLIDIPPSDESLRGGRRVAGCRWLSIAWSSGRLLDVDSQTRHPAQQRFDPVDLADRNEPPDCDGYWCRASTLTAGGSASTRRIGRHEFVVVTGRTNTLDRSVTREVAKRLHLLVEATTIDVPRLPLPEARAAVPLLVFLVLGQAPLPATIDVRHGSSDLEADRNGRPFAGRSHPPRIRTSKTPRPRFLSHEQ